MKRKIKEAKTIKIKYDGGAPLVDRRPRRREGGEPMSQAHNIGWCVAFVVSAGASLVWPGSLTPALLPVECGMAAYYGWRAWKGESRG